MTFVRHHHQKFPCEWITLSHLCQRILLLSETSLPYYCTQFYLPSVSNCSFYNATGRACIVQTSLIPWIIDPQKWLTHRYPLPSVWRKIKDNAPLPSVAVIHSVTSVRGSWSYHATLFAFSLSPVSQYSQYSLFSSGQLMPPQKKRNKKCNHYHITERTHVLGRPCSIYEVDAPANQSTFCQLLGEPRGWSVCDRENVPGLDFGLKLPLTLECLLGNTGLMQGWLLSWYQKR